MAFLIPMLVTVMLLVQAPAISPQAARVDQLLADADAARMKADFGAMATLSADAVAASRAIDDRGRLAKSLGALAQSSFFQSQPAACVPVAREALAVATPLNIPAVETVIVNTLAGCLQGIGDFEGAIDAYRRALELSRATKNVSRESQVLSNISQVYSRLGEFELARQPAEEAAARAREAKDLQGEMHALQIEGNRLGFMGRYDQAIASHRVALARIGEMPPSGLKTLVRLEEVANIAVFEYLGGHYAASYADLTSAISESRSGPAYPLFDGVAECYLGWSAYKLAHLDDAARWFMAARDTWRTIDDASNANEILLTEIGYARVLRDQGRVADALAIDQATIATLDRMRAGRNVTSTSVATSLLPSAMVYADTIGILISEGRAADAFDVSERYRARLFLDAIDDRRSGIGQSMTDAQRAQEAALSNSAMKLQMQIWDTGATPAAEAAAHARLLALDENISALRREVRRQDPRYGSVRFPDLMTSAAVRQALPADTAVVSYMMGDDRSFAWALTASGIRTATLPGRAILERRVNEFRDLLSTRPAPGASRVTVLRARAVALTRTLIAPIAPALLGKTRVIVMPDGALSTLPFEALSTVAVPGAPAARGIWLTQQFALSYAPSASALAAIGAPSSKPSSTLLALGDPMLNASATPGSTTPFTALPFTRVEVESIARIFGASAQTLLGSAATTKAFEQLPLREYRYIHLATHAFVNTAQTGRSGIVLSAGAGTSAPGVLEADEVTRLTLNADLVTLSACSSGLGRNVSGEGVMGLARSFLIAGAHSVAASLWNVNDQATATLMTTFYAGLHAGRPRDQALASARLALIKGANTQQQDPYYWAPFILIGAVR